jgi:hypothetical protein
VTIVPISEFEDKEKAKEKTTVPGSEIAPA